MAEKSDQDPLELRVRELESRLAEMAAYEPEDITAEELKAYKKVGQALAAVACRGCGRSCSSACIALAEDPLGTAAVYPCYAACRGACRSACVIAAAAMPCDAIETAAVACRSACSCRAAACRSACIAAADESIDIAAVACRSACSCRAAACRSACIAAADESLDIAAVACRGCGRSCACYLAAAQPCGPCMPGKEVPAAPARRGLGRFAGLGGE